MLQTIRDKINGIIAILFLGAIAVVFVFWGIDFQSGAPSYAAKVDGESIAIDTVRRAWQQRQSQLQQMLRDELPDDMVKSQQEALLDQFVRQALLVQRARDYGYHIDDATLAKRLMEFPQFQVDGKFSKDRYNAMLRASGLSEPRFESDLQADLLVDQLQSTVTASAFVAPYELERRYAIEKQQREIDYALIAASQFAPGITVTEEQIEKFFKENQSRFLLPETVDVQYVELTRDRAAGGVEVTDQALRDYYDEVKERFQSPERRRGRHILITAADGVDDAAAQKKAEELTAKAKGGADFEQLAKDNSKDPGSAAQGGDLGWAERGMFVGPFEDALFSMKPGEIRGPVKTEFGYHVLKLEETEAGHEKSFEEARAELEAEYRRDRSQTLFYDDSQKLADLAFSTLTELDSVAKTMNLPLETVKGFTREGGGELGAEPEIIEAVFSEDVLDRRQNSPLVTIGEDRVLVLRVTDHKQAEPRPLEQVRAQIEQELRTKAAREAAAQKGADAVARLQKGEPWSEVASALGLQPVGKRFVTRQDAVAPPAVLRAAFQAPSKDLSTENPHFAGVTTDDGNYAVFAVSGVRNADPATEASAEKDARTRRLEQQLGREEFDAYVAEAERRADIVKNEKVFE
jgi:peptidyl-prolyl cis-trans isomerase D